MMDTEKSGDHRTLVRLFQSVDSPIDSISLSAKYCETYLKRHGMPFLSGLVFCSGSSVSLSVRFAEITSCRNSIGHQPLFFRKDLLKSQIERRSARSLCVQRWRRLRHALYERLFFTDWTELRGTMRDLGEFSSRRANLSPTPTFLS